MVIAVREPSATRPRAALGAKRSAQVADRMVEDVLALGWPVGQVLGSESELLDRYEVSRAVFREAVRLVEHRQVARTRRGPGGGLVITEPTLAAVTDTVVLYLHRISAPIDEVFEARIVLEEISTEAACSRLDEDDVDVLRTYVSQTEVEEEPRATHSLIARMSHNPALALFVDVLTHVAMGYSQAGLLQYGVGILADTVYAHRRIAEAVIAGDVGRARHRMRKHLEAEVDYMTRRHSVRQLLPGTVVLRGSEGAKRAEAIARDIAQRIIGVGMRPGQLVGTEAELMERQGASRAVFREAVRILEHHQVARMRRGPGGGLYVVPPTAEAVTDIIAIYLARRETRPADLTELQLGVEMALVDLAAARIDEPGAGRLAEALRQEERRATDDRLGGPADLHAAVAAVAGNRVLELVAHVATRLSRIYQTEPLAAPAGPQVRDEVLRAHAGIVRAVVDGDRQLAAHRMRRHLDARGPVVC